MKDTRYYSLPVFDQNSFPKLMEEELETRATDKQLPFLGKAGRAAQELEFPSAKSEAWRWTDFSGLASESYSKLGKRPDKYQFSPSSDEVIFTDITQAILLHSSLLDQYLGSIIPHDTDRFTAMAAAYANQGFLLYVPKGAVIDKPLEVTIESSSEGLQLGHSLVVLEEGSSCTLVVNYLAGDSKESLKLENLELVLKAGASLNLITLTDLNPSKATISREKAALHKDARLKWIYGHLGMGKAKHFVDVDLVEEGSEAIVRGFYFVGTGEVVDLDTQVNHLAAHAHSDLLFKGAANGKGKVTWEGMIYVDPVAMGTDAYQSNRNLALSKEAEIHSIPGLEICADDVKCSHGATVGRINDDELFYLQNRGIPLDEAERLIVNGFFAEIIDEVKDETLHDQLLARINDKLSRN